MANHTDALQGNALLISSELGPLSAAPVPENVTVEQGFLRGPQKWHAIAISVVPAIGTVAAIWLAVLYGMTVTDIVLVVVMYAITMLGISVGYHRHFSHRAFKAVTPVRVALAAAGSMAAQGSVSYWVANHRRHHQYTDRPGDIHSPYWDENKELGAVEGFWHSHMGWTFGHRMTNTVTFAKDIYREPAIAMANKLYYVWAILGFVVPTLIGGLASMSWYGALTGFLWGGLVRMFLCYHFTNGIDSVTHIFGRRPFTTHDHSRNNAFWALPTMGEGWHNNHHAFPSSAIFGLTWWQVDVGAWLLRGLEKLGLVWDLHVATPEMIAARKARSTAA
jgi:stearoyl-CoA desaturase (delta-9 desaturase)